MHRKSGHKCGDSSHAELADCCCTPKAASSPRWRSCLTPAADNKRQPIAADADHGSKRQRLGDHDDSSCEGEWSSSETCMSERAQSHSYASSSCSPSSSPLPPSRQQCSDWHTLPAPIPVTFQEISRLQPQANLSSGARWDLLCSVEFSADGTQLAAAGVGKQVRSSVTRKTGYCGS